MREDMDKVIVERPRLKWGGRRGSRALPDPDASPRQEGLRRRHIVNGNPKHLNENLGPLKRYLERQVGRPWDKVWSEICRNLRPTSTVQQHVRDHVFDFVAHPVVSRHGQLYWSWRGGHLRPLAEAPMRLYVDPRTGILRRNKHARTWRQRRLDKEATAAQAHRDRRRIVDERTQLHLLADGAWWEVRLGRIPFNRHYCEGPTGRGQWVTTMGSYRDVVLAPGLSTMRPDTLYGKAGVYAVAKRQLSRKEKKAHGLAD